MKKKSLLPFVAALAIAASSCTNVNRNTNTEQTNFTLIDGKKGFVKDLMSTPYVEFKYVGDITNKTQNIYKRAFVKMLLEFTLENGQVLTDIDMAEGKMTFGAAEGSEMIAMYQPNQLYHIRGIKSNVISNDYAKYPIKSVLLKFRVELTDEINDTTESMDIKTEDITAEWQKVINGSVPTED